MRYVKAVALVGGVCLLALAAIDVGSRRADAADARRASIEMAARLEAARLDARIATTTAALASAPAPVSFDRLSRTLGQPVCSPDADRTCGLDAAAFDLVVDAATTDGAAVTVVDEAQVAVAVARDGSLLVSVVDAASTGAAAAGRGIVHPLRTPPAGADPAATAELETEFASGRWALTIDEASVASNTETFGLGARIAIAVQAAVGCLAVAGALWAIGRDHRGLRRQATTDSLTGLPNRAEFERRAGAMLARAERDGAGACLMLVDLDRFKAVNDSAGHAAGDRVLIESAGRLRRAVRESDIVGRWGGDEFVLLLAGVGDPLAVLDRVAAIATSLRGIPTTGNDELTASVGAAVAPLDGTGLAELLEVADRAMYRNKPAASRTASRRLS